MASLRKAFDVSLKLIFAYYAYNFIRKNFLPPPQAKAGSSGTVYECSWREGQRYGVQVFLSEEEFPRHISPEQDLVWQERGLQFGSWDKMQHRQSPSLSIPIRMRSNCWAHVYFHKENDEGQRSAQENLSRILYAKQKLTGTSSSGQWWYPELDVSIVNDPSPYDITSLHGLAIQRMAVDTKRKIYNPLVYLNEFWQTKERRVALTGGETELSLRLSFSPISLYKFQMLLAYDHSFKANEKLFDSEEGIGGIDSIKESLRSTQPWLLFLTAAVTLLHAFFDFLAFKNDIQFWRKQEDLTGLSVRSILLNCFSQFVILLYLLEQQSSAIVLLSTAFGLAVEIWKVFRVLHIKFGWSAYGLPKVWFEDKASYKDSTTKELDDKAMRYLSMVATPILVAYSAHAYVSGKYSSVYSWLIGSLVGFVYAFGFIMMTPQLFINWKLKSVAHLPWRVFIYKALNTFIDDLFAFIIKMPLLHRLACFRDDIIFLIYLYQRWIYPVDKTRANEFGQTFTESDQKDAKNK